MVQSSNGIMGHDSRQHTSNNEGGARAHFGGEPLVPPRLAPPASSPRAPRTDALLFFFRGPRSGGPSFGRSAPRRAPSTSRGHDDTGHTQQ